ncbi:MAG: hypothetical protein NTW25_08295 [Candidatus Kapabacteria bacterium]|nr:hypothetical protein [Candidatus Kapabacteria bacterium]
MKYLFYLAFASLLISSSCNDNPVVIKDPCVGARPVTANIRIYQSLYNVLDSNKKLKIYSDTVLTNIGATDCVHFESDSGYTQYEWLVGDDTTHHYTQNLTLCFTQPFGWVKVRLIVKGTPNKNCFPNDDGIDTMYKSFFVKDFHQPEFLGSYQGYNVSNPKDTFTVRINYENGDRGIIIYNINKGCDTPINKPTSIIDIFYLNKVLTIWDPSTYGYGCEAPVGLAILQEDLKTIVIDYKYGEKRVFDRFIGVRK